MAAKLRLQPPAPPDGGGKPAGAARRPSLATASGPHAEQRALDRTDVLLVRRLQQDFPLSERPFLDLAQQFALTERSVIGHLRRLRTSGVIAHVGPRIAMAPPRHVTLLAALQVPPERFAAVAAQVNALDDVVHSSQREHAFNLWVVLACADAPALAARCRQIEHDLGLPLFCFPSQRDYRVDWTLQPEGVASPTRSGFDQRLGQQLRNGLSLVPRPYHAVAARLGVAVGVVLERLLGLRAQGLLHDSGVLLDPARLGFGVNALTVWDVDDAQVDALGAKVAALDFVSHCRRRARCLPHWPYNLLATLHGQDRAEIERHALQIHCLLADACRRQDILFRSRLLKSTAPPAP